MTLAGDEKRIRALFSELALENQSATPRFEKLWKRAETTTPAPIYRRSFVLVAAALAIVITFSLAWWSRNKSVQSVPSVSEVISTSTTPVERERVAITVPRKSRQKRLTRRRKIERSVIQDALILARWQSPTQSFLQSPGTPVFKSLPQLNQSVRELESFLPNNDVKESKP